jgi:transposase
MRWEEAYESWQVKRLSQEEAAQLLGVCARTFRRYIDRYEDEGLAGLTDKRLTEVSHRKAPVDEVLRMEALYKQRYDGWTVKHFFERYQDEHRGQRCYTWVKQRLHTAGLVTPGKRRGPHRQQRPRSPLAGLMIHQDGSKHEWVPDQSWDLIVTMDDASSEIYSGFFVAEEGTLSSFRGVRETIERKGLFSSFYSDRGSHYWVTDKAGGKVDKRRLTQFGRAMSQLGIQMIAAYSPQARGRSERFFRTLQDRLPKELALEGIATMDQANAFLQRSFWKRFNRRFMVPPKIQDQHAFVPLMHTDLSNILCLQAERVVARDNCVSYLGKKLQIPPDRVRNHYVKATVRVHEYEDGQCAIFHGPRKLADYDALGQLLNMKQKVAA